MNAANSAAAQTITVAASHVLSPLIESPFDTRSVMISDTSVAISETPPKAAEPLRRIELAKKG